MAVDVMVVVAVLAYMDVCVCVCVSGKEKVSLANERVIANKYGETFRNNRIIPGSFPTLISTE